MFDWSKYRLKDLPFLATPAIHIDAADIRMNGKLFCREVIAEQVNRLIELARDRTNVIYVSSDTSVLGVGKSALMAAVYWQMRRERKDVIWIETTGGVSMSPTLGRIVDAMILRGHIAKIKRSVDVTKSSAIVRALSESIAAPSPTMVGALRKILSMPEEDVAFKYANIRRSILIYSTTELFRYFLALFKAAGVDYFYFFVDQFEEYIMAHRGPSGLRRLGDEVNDLFRSCSEQGSLIVSLHPEAERVLESAAGDFITTFAPLERSLIIVSPLQPEDALKVAVYYLDGFRSQGTEGDLYPFEESVIEYLAYKSEYNIRYLIISLRNALIEGAKQGYCPINAAFISNDRNHFRILGNVANEWKDFVKKKAP